MESRVRTRHAQKVAAWIDEHSDCHALQARADGIDVISFATHSLEGTVAIIETIPATMCSAREWLGY